MLSMKDNSLQALVIDDDPFVREMLSVYLENHNFHVSTAEDGQHGIVLIEGGLKPNLVIVDMLMPDKEGIETIIHIKKKVSDVRIVAISGGGSFKAEDLLRYAEMLGADSALVKPIDFEELDRKLKNLF